jgi:hypothetical protein
MPGIGRARVARLVRRQAAAAGVAETFVARKASKQVRMWLATAPK